MSVAATGTITGPEARGSVTVTSSPDGTMTLELANFWVAPGAPDVRLYLSPDEDGSVANAIDLGHVPDNETRFSSQLPMEVGADQMRSVVIYCKVFSVLFGHGTLAWSQ